MRGVRESAGRALNAAVHPLGLELVRRSTAEELHTSEKPSFVEGALPAGAGEILRWDNPKLAEYERRYRGHPATASSVWSRQHTHRGIELPYFRGDGAFVWQTRMRTDEVRYGLTTYYARLHDRLGLLELLSEDGLFGAHTYDVDGIIVSRDLLDSVAELTFLNDEIGLGSRPAGVLDIGAGYGRLAHRATAAFDQVRFICVDAVPVSTFVCQYYLSFCGLEGRTRVIPLDEVEHSAEVRSAEIAVNVHSFSECPLSAIEWWLDLLAGSRVQHLLIVPNTDDELLSSEYDGRRLEFMPTIEAHGFELVRKRPKYVHSDFVQKQGIFPSFFLLFSRL